MRFVTAEEFKQLPVGTVFMEYGPHWTGELSTITSSFNKSGRAVALGLMGVNNICMDNLPANVYINKALVVMEGLGFRMDYQDPKAIHVGSRSTFVVLDKTDIDGLIKQLNDCKASIED
jgi:hypothetical protein